MTKEEMKIYADKYRKTQKRLYKAFSVFIFLIAACLFAGAIILFINNNSETLIYVVASIMMILGIVDILISIKFIKHSKKRFNEISDIDAAKHYCKIHGFDSRIEK